MTKKSRKSSRGFILLLILALTLTMIPTTAFAGHGGHGGHGGPGQGGNNEGHIHLQSVPNGVYSSITVYFTDASGMPDAVLDAPNGNGGSGYGEWTKDGNSWSTSLGTQGYTLVDHIILVKNDGSVEYRTAASAYCNNNTGVDLTLGDDTTPLSQAVVKVYLDGQLVETDVTSYADQTIGTTITLGEAEIAGYQPATPEGKTVSYDTAAANVTSGTTVADHTLVLELYFVSADIPVDPPVEPEYTSVTVRKAWVLDNGGEAVPVSVQLLDDGEAYGEAVTLSDENQWTVTWTDLLVDGSVYTVAETEVPEGFTSSQVVAEDGAIVITNDDIESEEPPVEPPVNPPQDEDRPLVSWYVRFDGRIVDTSGNVSSHDTSLYTGELRTSEIIEENGYDIEENIYRTTIQTGWWGGYETVHVGALTDNASIEALAVQNAARGYYIDNFLAEGEDVAALVSWLQANPSKKVYFNDDDVTADIIASPEKFDIEWYVFKSEHTNGTDYTNSNCYHIDGVVVMRPETTEDLIISKTFVGPDAAAIDAAEDLFSIAVTDAAGAPVITLTTDSVAGGDYNYLVSKIVGANVAGEASVSRTYTWVLTLPMGAYTATEAAAAPEGYTMSAEILSDAADISNEAGEITFVNLYTALPPVDPPAPPQPETTSLTVQKVWNLEAGGEATEYVKVQLYKDGEPQGAVKLDAANNWSYTWDALEVGYTYTAVEIAVPDGFTASQETVNGVVVITNTYVPQTPPQPPVEPEYTSVTVQKVWVLDNGGSAVPVSVQLYKDGVAYGLPVQLSEANQWTCTWEGLLDDGSVYTVTELAVEGFTVTQEVVNGIVVITNDDIQKEEPPVEPETTGLYVQKVWQLDNGGAMVPVVVKLTADGVETGAAVTLDASNNWEYTFDGLVVGPVYSVVEVVPEGFTASYEYYGAEIIITNDDIAPAPVDPQPPVVPANPEPWYPPYVPPVEPPVVPVEPPVEPPVEIPDEEVPLADVPEEIIEDEEVPLAEAPKTGDNMMTWAMIALLSLVGLLALGRRKNETNN